MDECSGMNFVVIFFLIDFMVGIYEFFLHCFFFRLILGMLMQQTVDFKMRGAGAGSATGGMNLEDNFVLSQK